MNNSSGSDLTILEEEKHNPKHFGLQARSHSFEESECNVPSAPPSFHGLKLGDPQKMREGRDGYYIYPVLSGKQVLSHHRYKEFVWLRNELALQFPACATPALPEKEGVTGYWTNQDPLFYSFRKYGLERFLERVSKHPNLSQSPDFVSFVRDDEITFHIRMKKSESNKGWYGVISDWGSSVAGIVTGYIGSEQGLVQVDGDYEFSSNKNEIKMLYQQQDTLCGQGRSLVAVEENEIASNLALSKAYDNMSKVEKEGLAEKLKILAETHAQISEAHQGSFRKLKELVGQEMEDYKRITFGLLEALERREKIKGDKNLLQQFDLKEINRDLRQEILNFNQEKAYLSQLVSKNLITYKQELTEKIAEIWRDAYNKVGV